MIDVFCHKIPLRDRGWCELKKMRRSGPRLLHKDWDSMVIHDHHPHLDTDHVQISTPSPHPQVLSRGEAKGPSPPAHLCGEWLVNQGRYCHAPRSLDMYVHRDKLNHCSECDSVRKAVPRDADAMQKTRSFATVWPLVRDLTRFLHPSEELPLPTRPPMPQRTAPRQPSAQSPLTDSSRTLTDQFSRLVSEFRDLKHAIATSMNVPVPMPPPSLPQPPTLVSVSDGSGSSSAATTDSSTTSVIAVKKGKPRKAPETKKRKARSSKKATKKEDDSNHEMATDIHQDPASSASAHAMGNGLVPAKAVETDTPTRRRKKAKTKGAESEQVSSSSNSTEASVAAAPIAPVAVAPKVKQVKADHKAITEKSKTYYCDVAEAQPKQLYPPEKIPDAIFKQAHQLVDSYSRNRNWSSAQQNLEQKDLDPSLRTLFRDILLLSCWEKDFPIESDDLSRFIGSVNDSSATNSWTKMITRLKAAKAMPTFNYTRLTENCIRHACYRPGVTDPGHERQLLAATLVYFYELRDYTGYFQHKMNLVSDPHTRKVSASCSAAFFLPISYDSLYLMHVSQLLKEQKDQSIESQRNILSAFTSFVDLLLFTILDTELPATEMECPHELAISLHMEEAYSSSSAISGEDAPDSHLLRVSDDSIAQLVLQLVTTPALKASAFLEHLRKRIALLSDEDKLLYQRVSALSGALAPIRWFIRALVAKGSLGSSSSSPAWLPAMQTLDLSLNREFHAFQVPDDEMGSGENGKSIRGSVGLVLLALFEYHIEMNQPTEEKKEFNRSKENMSQHWTRVVLLCFSYVLELEPPELIPLHWKQLLTYYKCKPSTINHHRMAVEQCYPRFKKYITDRRKDGPPEKLARFQAFANQVRNSRGGGSNGNKARKVQSSSAVTSLSAVSASGAIGSSIVDSSVQVHVVPLPAPDRISVVARPLAS